MEEESRLLFRGIAIPNEDTLEEILDNIQTNEDKKQAYCQILSAGAHRNSLKQIFESLEQRLQIFEFSKDCNASQTTNQAHIQIWKKIQLLSSLFKKISNPQIFANKILIKIVEEGTMEIIESQLSDDFSVTFFGVMEYDNELYGKMDNNFREILLQKSRLVFGATIESKETIQKIKLTYRLLLFRDSVLALSTNDKLIIKVSSVISTNYYEIINHICNNKKVISSLFENLRGGDLQSLKMVHEIFTILKDNQYLAVSLSLYYQSIFGINNFIFQNL